jgi:hypothetical protein
LNSSPSSSIKTDTENGIGDSEVAHNYKDSKSLTIHTTDHLGDKSQLKIDDNSYAGSRQDHMSEYSVNSKFTTAVSNKK